MPYYVPGLDFQAWRGESRLILGIANSGLTEVLLQRAQHTALEETLEAAIIVADQPEAHLVASAEARSVLLLHHSELDTLAESLLAVQRTRRDRYGAAKNRLLKDEDEQKALDKPPAPERAERIIYSSRYLQADLYDNGGAELVVTFGDMHDRPAPTGLVDPAVAERSGLSELCIRTLTPNFFPAHDMQRLAAEAGPALNHFKTRWAWGIVQGAYGALKFAKSLGCERALVVSPLFSIDPLDMVDHRVNPSFDQSLHFEMAIRAADLPAETVAFYDPYDDRDAGHLAKLAALKDITTFRLPFAAPDATPWLFTAPPFMDALFSAYRNRDRAAMSRLATGARKRLSNRPFKMAYALATRRPATSIKIFRKYGQDKVQEWSSVCFVLAKAGHGAEILPLLEREADRLPDDVGLNVCAAAVALDMGLPEKALKHVKVGLRADGLNPTYNWIKQTAEAMIG